MRQRRRRRNSGRLLTGRRWADTTKRACTIGEVIKELVAKSKCYLMLFESDVANIAIPAVVFLSLCVCLFFFCVEKFFYPCIYPSAHPIQQTRPVAQIPDGFVPDGVPVQLRGPMREAARGGAPPMPPMHPMPSAPSFSIMMDRSNLPYGYSV